MSTLPGVVYKTWFIPYLSVRVQVPEDGGEITGADQNDSEDLPHCSRSGPEGRWEWWDTGLWVGRGVDSG